ncbi:hypothetical protein AB205_0152390 [Aquarana catesbeiana]|uniref:Uncharacterized protein n=1 Tax=Aquarana catesbeiana TaxID=8400 RepID=A0A2G9RQR3_AQUCT|nr:hypothetical protein AB205_0152390 [Aquarana catesbeiana]
MHCKATGSLCQLPQLLIFTFTVFLCCLVYLQRSHDLLGTSRYAGLWTHGFHLPMCWH